MENKQYKYDAFISYRHCEPDMSVAKALHSQLERFRIPAAVRKLTGIQKIGKVFRDQEELPTSDDLGTQIERALAESKWLIVIASEQLLQSKWCLKEVDTFLALGRRDHILILLVSGEPETSFPRQLRFLNIDGEEIEKEPLAADVRAETLPQMKKKLQQEKLRLLAPMLGVGFDDLRQRHRERRMRMTVGILSAIAVFFALFGSITLYQSLQIRSQRDQLLIGQSQSLAAQSINLLKKGDVSGALLKSFSALPGKGDSKPLVPEAKEALVSAMLFDQYDTYRPIAQLPQPVAAISPDGLSFITTGGGALVTRLYDTTSLSIKSEYAGAAGAAYALEHPKLALYSGWLSAPRFSADGSTFYLTTAQNGIYNSESGKLVQAGKLTGASQAAEFSLTKYLVKRNDDGVVQIWGVDTGSIVLTLQNVSAAWKAQSSSDDRYLFFADEFRSEVWELASGRCVFSVDTSDYDRYGTIDRNCVFSPDAKYVYETRCSVRVADESTPTTSGFTMRKHYRMYEVETGTEIFCYSFDEDYTNRDLNLLNENENTLSKYPDDGLACRFSPDGKTFIVQTASKGYIAAYNLATGKELFKIMNPSQFAFATFSPDGGRILLCGQQLNLLVANFGELHDIDGGFIEIIDASTGKILETLFVEGFQPLTAYFAGQDVILVNGTDLETKSAACRVYFREENELVQRLGLWDDATAVAVYPDGSGRIIIKDGSINARVLSGTGEAVLALRDSVPYTLFAASTDGSVIVGANDTSIAVWDGITGERRSVGSLEYVPRQIMVSDDLSRIGLVVVREGSSLLQVLDMETGRTLSIGHVGSANCYAQFNRTAHTILFASSDTLGLMNADTARPIFLSTEYSFDAFNVSTLIVAWNEDNHSIAVAAEKAEGIGIHNDQTGEKLYTIPAAGHVITALSCSPDHSKLLAAASDGYIAVYDAKSGDALLTINSGSVLRRALFSNTGRYILTSHGVFDAESGVLLMRFVAPGKVYVYAASANDGGVWVREAFSNKTWTKLYPIPDFESLIPATGSVIRSRAFTDGE